MATGLKAENLALIMGAYGTAISMSFIIRSEQIVNESG